MVTIFKGYSSLQVLRRLVDDDFLNDTSYDVEDEIIFDEDGDNDLLEQIPIEESLTAQQQTLMWSDDMYLRIAPGEGSFLFLFLCFFNLLNEKIHNIYDLLLLSF